MKKVEEGIHYYRMATNYLCDSFLPILIYPRFAPPLLHSHSTIRPTVGQRSLWSSARFHLAARHLKKIITLFSDGNNEESAGNMVERLSANSIVVVKKIAQIV